MQDHSCRSTRVLSDLWQDVSDAVKREDLWRMAKSQRRQANSSGRANTPWRRLWNHCLTIPTSGDWHQRSRYTRSMSWKPIRRHIISRRHFPPGDPGRYSAPWQKWHCNCAKNKMKWSNVRATETKEFTKRWWMVLNACIQGIESSTRARWTTSVWFRRYHIGGLLLSTTKSFIPIGKVDEGCRALYGGKSWMDSKWTWLLFSKMIMKRLRP